MRENNNWKLWIPVYGIYALFTDTRVNILYISGAIAFVNGAYQGFSILTSLTMVFRAIDWLIGC